MLFRLPPTAEIVAAPQDATPDAEVLFEGVAAPGSYALAACTWDFGDGAVEQGDASFTRAAHTYTAAGSVCTATFTVVDAGGGMARDSAVITILPEPFLVLMGAVALLPVLRRAMSRRRE